MNLPKAKSAARKLGIQAAKEDTWMQPLEKNEIDEEDFGAWQMAHRAAWEETDHFCVFYDNPLRNLVYEIKCLQSQDDSQEVYATLLDEFWEAWEDKVKLLDRWQNETNRKAAV